MPDEGDVGCTPDANQPRASSRVPNAVDQRLEHIAVRKPGDRRAETVGKSRTQRDHDVVRSAAFSPRTFLDDDRLLSLVERVQ